MRWGGDRWPGSWWWTHVAHVARGSLPLLHRGENLWSNVRKRPSSLKLWFSTVQYAPNWPFWHLKWLWIGAMGGIRVRVILFLVLVREATNEENDTNMERKIKAPKSDKKLSRLEEERRVVGALRENQEGCPPRLAEFLVWVFQLLEYQMWWKGGSFIKLNLIN